MLFSVQPLFLLWFDFSQCCRLNPGPHTSNVLPLSYSLSPDFDSKSNDYESFTWINIPKGVVGSGELNQLIKLWSYKPEGLSFGPRTHVKIPGMVAHSCHPSLGNPRGVPGLADSLLYLLTSKKALPEMRSKSTLWPPPACTQHTQAQAATQPCTPSCTDVHMHKGNRF